MNFLDPDLVLPFNGYRRLDDEHLQHDLVPSLSHFFEAEKLRGTSEEMRQEILLAPTPRAARKLSRRYRSEWRKDWLRIRPRVFAAGLVMQMIQSKEAVQMARRAAANAAEGSVSTGRIAGLPVSFVSNVTSRVMASISDKAARRLGIVTLRRSVPADMSDRLDALFSRGLPLVANIYAGNDSAFAAERWCMSWAVPLRYFGEGAVRFRSVDQAAVLRNISTLIICAPPSRGEVVEFLALATKTRRKVVDLTRAAPEVTED